MPILKVAHVRHQGVDLVIAPLNSDFKYKTLQEQRSVINELQVRSRAAGLAGTIVPVWDNGAGRMAFIAPNNWHPYFSSLDLSAVWGSVNREISW